LDEEVRKLRHLIAGKVETVRRRVGEYKVPFAVDYLTGLTEKTLVFAHHTDVIIRLVQALRDQGVAWFTGSSSLEARHRAAAKFQGDPEIQFFIGNIEAAGTGITLTMASRVVFVEPDWRGTYMEQAEDRAHRIGQNRPVMATYFLLEGGSTDDWMSGKAEEKQAVIDEVLNSTEKPVRPARGQAQQDVSNKAKGTFNAASPDRGPTRTVPLHKVWRSIRIDGRSGGIAPRR
jgi:SWI/SNF-related matrix-associated actin-dependent regulator 1 of chromatin subfamily A